MMHRDREEVIEQLCMGLEELLVSMDRRLIPDRGAEMAYALPDARDPDDVAVFSGGIDADVCKGVVFGAGGEASTTVLTAMKFDPHIRSAALVRGTPAVLRILDDLFFQVCSFDRGSEPPGIRAMDWGVAQCCKEGVPDAIYDRSGAGRDAVVRIIGEDPSAVAHAIIKVSNRSQNYDML
jgi:thiamine-phosphate diphosphorylase